MKRKLTDQERAQIARKRPWFGPDRRAADLDLAMGEAEIIPFQLLRFWNANECGPPCCPRALLVETVDRRFLYLESWSALPSTECLGTNSVAHRAAASKTLLALESAGEMVTVEERSVREALLDFAAPECDWVEIDDLPPELRKVIETA